MLARTSVAYGHHVDHRSEVTEVIILQIARDITGGLAFPLPDTDGIDADSGQKALGHAVGTLNSEHPRRLGRVQELSIVNVPGAWVGYRNSQ